MPDGTFQPIDKPIRHKRRSYADNQQLAQPKPDVRLRDDAVLEWARKLGRCEICGKPRKTMPCHAKTRGSGGADTIGNIVAGCQDCHTRTEGAGQAGKNELFTIIAKRKMTPELANLLQRTPEQYIDTKRKIKYHWPKGRKIQNRNSLASRRAM